MAFYRLPIKVKLPPCIYKFHYSTFNNPPSYFKNGSQPKTYNEIKQQTPHDDGINSQYSHYEPPKSMKYLAICTSIAYLTIAGALIYVLIDQRKQVKRYRKQLIITKKSQKEMLIQTQHYKKKLTMNATKTAKNQAVIQGKMQVHIALLRQQLIDQGLDPVTIDKALKVFEEQVKMTTTGAAVTLWIPGESNMKSLIPDPNEYSSDHK